jgi:hydroxymethylpyrimidine pyrophosphatase-like HAD family hydrolase
MKLRMIVIDLDGTLLDPAGKVPPAHREAVQRARASGLEVVIATGRNWSESREALEAIGPEGVMIGAGGAMLCTAEDGGTLARRVLPGDVVESLTECILRHGHLVHLLQDHDQSDVDYIMVGTGEPDPATSWWLREHDVKVRHLAGLADLGGQVLEHTVRVGTVGTESSLRPSIELLQSDLGDRIHLQHWPAVVESKATGNAVHLLEVFQPGVDKWTMIQTILEDRSIEASQVVAIGDGLNDIAMVREAGQGIAMGQSDPRVRAVADHVVGCNASGGVAEAVDLVLDQLDDDRISGTSSGTTS